MPFNPYQPNPPRSRANEASASRLAPSVPWDMAPAMWDFSRPLILGVLNITPDSFSDGGDNMRPETALARAKEMAAEGADMIDLGGASSHPKAAQTSIQEELSRVLPILERLNQEVSLPFSIDSQHPEVAEACLALKRKDTGVSGIRLINDVSGMTNPEMARMAARHDAVLVITYNNFTVPKEASGLSFVSDMLAFFDERIEEAQALGVQRMVLDPGYGFGKTLQENLTVLQALPLLQRFQRPIMACTSRKGSLGRLTGEANPRERLGASLASTLYAVTQGAHMVRVHDVKACHQALTTWRAFAREGE